MSRKNKNLCRAVVYPLARRLSSEWKFIDISDSFMTENELCELFSSAYIFLSFGTREGFNNPPLEAAVGGCQCVGFHGYGGLDYWGNATHFHPVEEGDIVGFMEQVIKLVDGFEGHIAKPFSSKFNFIESARSFETTFDSIKVPDYGGDNLNFQFGTLTHTLRFYAAKARKLYKLIFKRHQM